MKADRVELCDHPLDIAGLYEWAASPECGAIVVFSGTVRDHAEGRSGVTSLSYEAYRDVAVGWDEADGDRVVREVRLVAGI